MSKLEWEEPGSVSISERQKLQWLYTQGVAAYGSVRNLVKASNLVRHVLHSKPPYIKIALAKHKIKRLNAFAGYKIENQFMTLPNIQKVAKDNNGVKYLPTCHDLFDRNVDAKEKKRKVPQKRFVQLWLSLQKNRPKKNWVDKGTEFAGESEELCKAEGIQLYSTMSEIKAAFAERTIRSLKNMLHRYMEDNGYKWNHKLTQFVTTLNSRRNAPYTWYKRM